MVTDPAPDPDSPWEPPGPPPAPAHATPYLRETLDTLTLHFSGSEIQSRMQLGQPDTLSLAYTRLMMGFLAFVPRPRRLALLGLGGGSLAKFCHRHLPASTALTVVEVNPHVIALREAFHIPPDGPRFRVVEADAAHFVADTGERFDVLMVDAFDETGMPPHLGTLRFYGDCLDVLAAAGLMVVNLHSGHPHHALYVDRLRGVFGADAVLEVPDPGGSNSVVFAAKAPAGPMARAAAGRARRPEGLSVAAWTQLAPAFAIIASARARA